MKLQRRASDLAEATEKQGGNGPSARLRQFQRQQVEREMAKLRSEAVQARRLAEHIENLSQDARQQQRRRKWKPVMTETRIVDPGHAQRMKRRVEDRPAPGGNQLSFNPLHPSMELPPEQLIRLLGMSSKKTRKARRHTSKTRPAEETAATPAKATPRPAAKQAGAAASSASPDRSIQYERDLPPVFEERRRGLLLPAAIAGVVAGIAVSAYLLLSQPVPVSKPAPAAPAATSPAAGRLPVKKPAPAVAERKPVAKPAARPAAAPPPAMSIEEQARWQARIETESRRLRSAAEQRFAQRMLQLEAAAEAAAVAESVEVAPVEAPAPQPATPAADFSPPEETQAGQLPPAQPAPLQPWVEEPVEAPAASEVLPGAVDEYFSDAELTDEVFPEQTPVDSVDPEAVADTLPAVEMEPATGAAMPGQPEASEAPPVPLEPSAAETLPADDTASLF